MQNSDRLHSLLHRLTQRDRYIRVELFQTPTPLLTASPARLFATLPINNVSTRLLKSTHSRLFVNGARRECAARFARIDLYRFAKVFSLLLFGGGRVGAVGSLSIALEPATSRCCALQFNCASGSFTFCWGETRAVGWLLPKGDRYSALHRQPPDIQSISRARLLAPRSIVGLESSPSCSVLLSITSVALAAALTIR